MKCYNLYSVNASGQRRYYETFRAHSDEQAIAIGRGMIRSLYRYQRGHTSFPAEWVVTSGVVTLCPDDREVGVCILWTSSCDAKHG